MNNRKKVLNINEDTIIIPGDWEIKIKVVHASISFWQPVRLHKLIEDVPALEKKLSHDIGVDVKLISARELK